MTFVKSNYSALTRLSILFLGLLVGDTDDSYLLTGDPYNPSSLIPISEAIWALTFTVLFQSFFTGERFDVILNRQGLLALGISFFSSSWGHS